MTALIHSAFVWIMELVRTAGYAGIAFLMALESSIVPVPSELVIPPAAYWAKSGQFSFLGVVLAGTVGSWVGSAISYWLSYWIGRPLLLRFGGYVGFPERKILMAEEWVKAYGTGGIFFARLLPVIRHLISIPAGLCRMPFGAFSAATSIGAGIWCGVLFWFGQKIITEPMLADATGMVKEIKHQMHYIVALVALLAGLYAVRVYFSAKGHLAQPSEAASEI